MRLKKEYDIEYQVEVATTFSFDNTNWIPEPVQSEKTISVDDHDGSIWE